MLMAKKEHLFLAQKEPYQQLEILFDTHKASDIELVLESWDSFFHQSSVRVLSAEQSAEAQGFSNGLLRERKRLECFENQLQVSLV